MLNRLYLNNCFTHHDKTFKFENGLTGIIGPNESGKSLIVETIRFALFGSKALRGKSEDYKKLHVELDFTVGGVDYQVVRKGVKVTLEGGDQQVSGTKPVDEAVRKILGYDLNVFDVANACNQGNIEALSEMTPANRKAMVDKTVGLTVLDDLIKFAGQEGNALKREAEAINRTLVEPVEPVEPDHYMPSGSVEPRLKETQAQLAEFNQLTGFLSRTPAEPEAPIRLVDETAAELQVYEDNRLNIERSIQNLTVKMKNIEPEEYTEGDLDWREANLDAWDAWKQRERLMAQGHICCPECNHEWPVADLGDLADVAEPDCEVSMTRRELAQHRARLGNDAQIGQLQQQINALEIEFKAMPCKAKDLALARDYEAKEQAYTQQKAAWDQYNSELPEKQARHEELKGIDQVVASLQTELQQAQQFERDLYRYRNDMVDFESKQEEVADLTNRCEEFLKAREIIQALKVSVKSHLLPSLNKVASVLLSQMTGGERYQVEVDDDFEILIDGQRIATLSGSGKAVANLAIRIALGQILTNRVFSVFMADEVDASMDDDRAEYTAQALRRLTEMVGQVITITHKRPETDHTIELKK